MLRRFSQKIITFMAITTGIINFHVSAQSLNTNWKQELNSALQKFLQCTTQGTDKNTCVQYIGESLNTVYKINDFYSEKANRYMTVSEISAFLKSSSAWVPLGQSYDQKVLATAQDHANARKAVVAVYLNAEGVGHLALVTPGELKPSGSWGLNVPSAVSFFPIDPEKSFVDKGLSFAFTKNMLKEVVLYARKY
jgi:hypothetical protein